MSNASSALAIIRRGVSLRDRLAIALLLCFRSRPGFWRLWAKLVGDGDHVITVATPRGPARLVFDPLDVSELTVIDELLPGDIYIVETQAETFVDCGAFRGISTVYLQDQVKAGRVVAYEPQTNNFGILTQRLARYLPEAVCVNAAVGADNGKVCFEGEGVGGTMSAIGIPVRVVGLQQAEALVSAKSLLLKMDIEGAEKEVLPKVASLLPEVCLLLIETHFPEDQTKALLAPLEAVGFSCREVRRRQYEDPRVWFIDWEFQRRGMFVRKVTP